MPSKTRKIFPLMAALLAMSFIYSLGEVYLRFNYSFRCEFDDKDSYKAVKNLNNYFCQENNPHLNYRMQNFINVKLIGKTFNTNGHGFRTPPFKVKKPEGITRILGIGDSVMAGWGVAEQKDFLRLIENAYKKENRKVEVINLATPGYNAIQESVLLEKWLSRLSPDLVVINYVGNDWEEENEKRKAHFSSYSYLLNFLVLNGQKLMGLIPRDERLEYAYSAFKADVPKHLGEAYSKMANLLKEKKVPSIVVLDSRYESPMAPHFGVINILNHFNLTPVDLMTIIRGKHIGTPEQNRETKDRHNKELVIPGDGHPNEKWHFEVSNILKGLIDQKLF